MKLCVPKGFKNIKQQKNRPGDRKKKKVFFCCCCCYSLGNCWILEFVPFLFFFQRYCRRVMLFCVSLLPLRVVIWWCPLFLFFWALALPSSEMRRTVKIAAAAESWPSGSSAPSFVWAPVEMNGPYRIAEKTEMKPKNKKGKKITKKKRRESLRGRSWMFDNGRGGRPVYIAALSLHNRFSRQSWSIQKGV